MKQYLIIALAKGVGGLAVIALHAMLLRNLGERDYGIFALFYSALVVIAILANGGWMHSITVLATRYRVRKRWERYRAVVNQSLGVGFALPILIAIPLYGAAGFLFSDTDQVHAFRIALLVIPFLALIYVIKGLFRSIGRADMSILPDETVLPLLAIAVLYLMQSNNYFDAVTLYGIVVTVIALASLFMVLRMLPANGRQSSARSMFAQWTAFTLPMAAGEIGNIVISRTDILMVSALATPEEAAASSIAIRLASVLVLVYTVIWPVFAGRFSQAYVKRDTALTKQLLLRAIMMAGGFALLPAIILIIWPQLATLVFGDAAYNALWPIRLIAAAYFIHAATGPIGLLMMMQGMQKQYSMTALIAGTINVVLNFGLVPEYGATGAAIATLITFILWKSTLAFQILRFWNGPGANRGKSAKKDTTGPDHD